MELITSKIVVAEGRIDELCRQLAIKRYARHARRDSMMIGSHMILRNDIIHIEMRARVRLRTLPALDEGFVLCEDTEDIWVAAVSSVRNLIRSVE